MSDTNCTPIDEDVVIEAIPAALRELRGQIVESAITDMNLAMRIAYHRKGKLTDIEAIINGFPNEKRVELGLRPKSDPDPDPEWMSAPSPLPPITKKRNRTKKKKKPIVEEVVEDAEKTDADMDAEGTSPEPDDEGQSPEDECPEGGATEEVTQDQEAEGGVAPEKSPAPPSPPSPPLPGYLQPQPPPPPASDLNWKRIPLPRSERRDYSEVGWFARAAESVPPVHRNVANVAAVAGVTPDAFFRFLQDKPRRWAELGIIRQR